MGIKQESGGAIQSILDFFRISRNAYLPRIRSNALHIIIVALLGMLLLTCFEEACLAQTPQNGWKSGNSRGDNVSVGRSAIYWLEALPKGMPVEDPGQLLQVNGGLDGHENPIHIPGDELIAYRSSAASDTDSQGPPQGIIVIRLFSGKGFALKDNETLVLRMNVELIRDVDPVNLRNLMTSNRSIDDIKEELNAMSGAASLRGSLRINEISYALLNTHLMPSVDNATTIDADIATLYLKPAPGRIMRPNASDKIPITGHINVIVAPAEGGVIGKGGLTMNSSEYSGNYNVLLQMEKPLPHDTPDFREDAASPARQ